MLATRGGSRTPGLYHNTDRSVGSADQVSLLNPRFEPAMATRGGRRPTGLSQRLYLTPRGCDTWLYLTPRFEPSMATRGRRPPQHANSAHGAGRHRVPTPSQNRKKGRGWHTNREGERAILVSHLAISCRDPKRLRAVIEFRHEEGAGHNHNPIRGARQGHRRFWSRTSTLHRVGYNRLTSL